MTPASAHLRAAALTIRSGEILSLLLGGVAIGAATGHAATRPSSVFAMLTPMMVAMISLLTVNPTVLRLRGNDQLPCPTLPVSARSRGLLDLFAVVAGVWAIAGPVTGLLNAGALISNFWPALAMLLLPSALRLGLGRCRKAPMAWMVRPAFYVGPLVLFGILPPYPQNGRGFILDPYLPLDPWSGPGDLSFALLYGVTTMVLLSSAFQIRAFARMNPAEAHQHALTTEQGPW